MNSIRIGLLTELTLRNKAVERDLQCSRQFLAVNLFPRQGLSLKERRLCLEIAAEANKGFFSFFFPLSPKCPDYADTFKPEQLIASSGLPHIHHPALSLRLGCHGQPEAVSQLLETLLRCPVPQIAVEK